MGRYDREPVVTTGAWLQICGNIAKVRTMVQKSQIESSILRHIFLPGVYFVCLAASRGVMMMRGLAGSFMVPVLHYPTVQSRKLISGLNVYGWVADFPCVRFGFVMRQGVSWCCQMSLASSPASGTPSPRYLKSAIY
jgi:hypothetical protein